MRTFWLFRSDIKEMEYYHKYNTLEVFENKCHDYYMLLPIWLLRHDYIDFVVVWRLSDKKQSDIVFDVNGKKFIQRWVKNFNETFDYPKPDISFFRGGFRKYDVVTKINPNHFGVKLYLGAGVRQFPQYGGKYDCILIEDERDFNSKYKCIPFYKTASPNIFYPITNKVINMEWDICWPCNFQQKRYKGQSFFMKQLAQNILLRRLKIVHCGNQQHVGQKMAEEYGLNNIDFLGSVNRPQLNEILNSSRFGLNLSNLQDGCPRVSTEILMSGTPLILRNTVRLMNYYKKEDQGVINISDNNLAKKIIEAMEQYNTHKVNVLNAIQNNLSFDNTNQKNINEWKKI